jgi:hypothetical protein
MWVARVRVGRILIWMTSALCSFFWLVDWLISGRSSGLWGLALILGLIAFFGGLEDRKKRSSPGPFRWLLFKMALGAFLFALVVLVMWWRNRRALKAAPVVPPPLPEDVDRWARAELETERAA